MRIFFIGSYKDKPTTGGHLYHSKMIEVIKKMGHELKVISVFQMSRFFRTKPASFIYAFFLLVQRFPDVIIQVSDTALRYIPFSFIVNLFDIPVIQLVHHIDNAPFDLNLKKRLTLLFMKYNFKNAKMIIVNSKHTKLQVITLVGPRIEKKIIIIRPRVDIKFQLRIKRNYQNKKFWNFISVGAIIKRKGYHYLLPALGNLKEFSFRCYIVGAIDDKKYYDSLIDLTRKYNLEEKVIFTGYLSNEELLELYTKSDLFILSSLLEGYGIVLCEALCCDLPVIATNVGGVPEIISHQYNGLLIKPKNVKAIEDALRLLISKPYLTEELSNNAFEFCGNLGGWQEMQKKVEKLIKEIDFKLKQRRSD